MSDPSSPTLRLGDPKHVHKTPRATLSIWFPVPTVVLQRVQGHADLGVADAIAKYLGAQIATGVRIAIFDDFQDVTGYDSDARLSLTRWTKANQASITGIHILVRTRIVAMGVSVANLALGGNIRSYDSRKRFETALAARCQEPR